MKIIKNIIYDIRDYKVRLYFDLADIYELCVILKDSNTDKKLLKMTHINFIKNTIFVPHNMSYIYAKCVTK